MFDDLILSVLKSWSLETIWVIVLKEADKRIMVFVSNLTGCGDFIH